MAKKELSFNDKLLAISEKYKTGEVLQVYNAGTKVYLWES